MDDDELTRAARHFSPCVPRFLLPRRRRRHRVRCQLCVQQAAAAHHHHHHGDDHPVAGHRLLRLGGVRGGVVSRQRHHRFAVPRAPGGLYDGLLADFLCFFFLFSPPLVILTTILRRLRILTKLNEAGHVRVLSTPEAEPAFGVGCFGGGKRRRRRSGGGWRHLGKYTYIYI